MNRTIATIMTVFVAMVLIVTAMLPITTDMIDDLKYDHNTGSFSYTEVGMEDEAVTYTFLEDGGMEIDGVRVPGMDTRRSGYTPLVISDVCVLAVGEGSLVRMGRIGATDYVMSVATYTCHDPATVRVTPYYATITHNTTPVIHESVDSPLVRMTLDGDLTLVREDRVGSGVHVREDSPVYLWQVPTQGYPLCVLAHGDVGSLPGVMYIEATRFPSVTVDATASEPGEDGVITITGATLTYGADTYTLHAGLIVPKEIPKEGDQPIVTLLGIIPLMVIIGLLLVVVRGMTGSGGFSRSEGGGDTYEDF